MAETSKPTPKDPRKERLAKALRDNLKRRKAQARERAPEGSGQGGANPAAPNAGGQRR